MILFETLSYRDYLTHRIQALPGLGRGELGKMATHLKIQPSLMSQILKGPKNFTIDQGLKIAAYLKLSALETEYWVTLIELDRSSTSPEVSHYQKRLKQIKKKATYVQFRLPRQHSLSESDRALFYSTWMYSALRLLTSIPKYQSITALSQALEIEPKSIQTMISFLCETGLCIKDGDQIKMGPQNTHIGSHAALVSRHHLNWRIKCMEQIEAPLDSETEMRFTAPLTLSVEDASKVRLVLLEAIEKISSLVKESNSQALYCLNLDWIKPIKKNSA